MAFKVFATKSSRVRPQLISLGDSVTCHFMTIPPPSLPPSYSKLLQLGWTKEQINTKVKDKFVSETESIYGTLYGTLGEEEQ